MKTYRIDLMSAHGQSINACYVNADTGFEARTIGKVWLANNTDTGIWPSDGVISRVAPPEFADTAINA